MTHKFKYKIKQSFVSFLKATSSGSMQILINTLSFGKITLSVNPLDNIGFVKKMTRRKIVERFEGYDVELIASCEKSLTYAGKQLEDKLTIADYNIQKGNEIHMTFGLDGGAIKRPRLTINDMSVQDGDCALIRECFAVGQFDGEKLLEIMSYQQLQEYSNHMDINRGAARITEKTIEYIKPFQTIKERGEQHDETEPAK